MKQKAETMTLLYDQHHIEKSFSKEKFKIFLQEDMIFPLEGTRKKYRKGDILIDENDEVDDIILIESGHVIATKNTENLIDFYANQDIIGLSNMLLGSQSEYTYQVISNELMVIRYAKEDIIDKVINTQEGYFYHYVYMQSQVSRMMEKEELLRLPSEERISLAILSLGEKFGEIMKDDPDTVCFPIQISKGMLARYTNLNPNTVTNILQKLQAEDIIYSIRRTIYFNAYKLQEKLDAQ
ncbi:Crp/Fnr family transcriptional regulator [Listeria rustica]|uniref:Crp/Fnr family transcriptional regulator n=1 Tax=Listeria rustica TaxID=2713503 RepID=A0A7W1T6L5_9LIST|nr:Crp/Fnr family transcriptional regulator [Listeria rustica]MBA3926456.1 Crp/Fnr family transcriptional regulator [Listeria rustica]